MRSWIALVGIAAASATAQAQPAGEAAPAPGPSFDCTAAGSTVENMICADDQLRAMDLGLDRFYASARRGPQARRVMREQRRWLQTRRGSCSNRACLYEALSDRLRDLSEDVGRDLPAYLNEDGPGTLVIVPLGQDWYAFGALAEWEGPPTTSAAVSGAFRLQGDRARIARGNEEECDHSLIRLSGDRWRIVAHPTAQRPHCGAFNISIEGTYERRR